jgi:hypothetical protein
MQYSSKIESLSLVLIIVFLEVTKYVCMIGQIWNILYRVDNWYHAKTKHESILKTLKIRVIPLVQRKRRSSLPYISNIYYLFIYTLYVKYYFILVLLQFKKCRHVYLFSRPFDLFNVRLKNSGRLLRVKVWYEVGDTGLRYGMK